MLMDSTCWVPLTHSGPGIHVRSRSAAVGNAIPRQDRIVDPEIDAALARIVKQAANQRNRAAASLFRSIVDQTRGNNVCSLLKTRPSPVAHQTLEVAEILNVIGCGAVFGLKVVANDLLWAIPDMRLPRRAPHL